MTNEMFEKYFNIHTKFTYTVNKMSYEFKINADFINEYLLLGKITFVSKKRTKLTYKLNRCFTSDLGLKKQCVVQCDVCKNIQIQKEFVQIKINTYKEIQLLKKLKEPSKIQQILNILKK